MIKYKETMYKMLEKGTFGNKLKSWRTISELKASGYDGLVGFRGTVESGLKLGAAPNIWASNAERYLKGLQISPDKIMISEGSPDEHQILQGELSKNILTNYDLYFRWVRSTLKMREALLLSHVQDWRNLRAKILLKSVLLPGSYDDIMELLELYEDSTIELTVFNRPVGNCRQRNAIIWEVRNY